MWRTVSVHAPERTPHTANRSRHPRRHAFVRRSFIRGSFVALPVVAALVGCSASDLVQNKYPPNVTPPSALQNVTGTMAIYAGAIYDFREGFGAATISPGSYVVVSGALSDEINTGSYDTGSNSTILSFNSIAGVSARQTEQNGAGAPSDESNSGSFLRPFNLARNEAGTAIRYLKAYAPDSAPNLVGNMYIVRGMSDVYLADIYCSGIPLSETNDSGGFKYTTGSTTTEVYTTAVAQFDSALMNIPDSLGYKYAAEVGKGRALLDLGEFSEAAAAVADVPTAGWQYLARYSNTYAGQGKDMDYAYEFSQGSTTLGEETYFGTIADREGGNGLPFVSANDPRAPVVASARHNSTYPATTYWIPKWMVPASYGGTSTRNLGGESIVISNGIEARLIEAEVKAQANDASYLDILNTLRTTCTTTVGCATPAPAGTGGVAGLPPLSDPGTQHDRLKQVFDERGYWLLLTGHRQGDLRRLVRVYKWPQETVYPTGTYPLGTLLAYGTYTNLPYPNTEQAINPLYHGCINRDA